jgi:hypothetical protein
MVPEVGFPQSCVGCPVPARQEDVSVHLVRCQLVSRAPLQIDIPLIRQSKKPRLMSEIVAT